MRLAELLSSRDFVIACPIPVRNVDMALEKAERAVGEGADIVEFRLDYLTTIETDEYLEAVKRIVSEFPGPKIITIREKSEGGFRETPPLLKIETLSMLQNIDDTYVDIELEFYKKYINSLRNLSFSGLIISKHYFYERPTERELTITLNEALRVPGVDLVKIASIVSSEKDLLDLLKIAPRKERPYIAVFPMSNNRVFRLVPPLLGSKLMFCSLDEGTAPGQIQLGLCNKFREFVEDLK
ncbi:MAG: type I 3-dehydroquinate dehydratase [Crenarchaeota archaeon]|nr:type I 3-dehydroquinate dehydratase [Thermoproteota archaeon]